MQWRFASPDDVRRLAELNHELIADEGHRNPMNVDQLENRMRAWLATEYRAVVFTSGAEVLAYALFRDDEADSIHVRQFFVIRARRREGIGRDAIRLFVRDIVPKNKRVVLDVLVRNTVGHAFWRAVGFREYAVTLERLPDEDGPDR
jgi:predicted GNAT family acetyltransferase